MNTAASHALGYPYFPYYPVVLDILRSRLAGRVLDAPCSRGWLGDMVRPATGRDVELDGVGPAGLPASANGYRRLTVHDLETPLPAAAPTTPWSAAKRSTWRPTPACWCAAFMTRCARAARWC